MPILWFVKLTLQTDYKGSGGWERKLETANRIYCLFSTETPEKKLNKDTGPTMCHTPTATLHLSGNYLFSACSINHLTATVRKAKNRCLLTNNGHIPYWRLKVILLHVVTVTFSGHFFTKSASDQTFYVGTNIYPLSAPGFGCWRTHAHHPYSV